MLENRGNMIQKLVRINNRFGLHARPASKFVEIADAFESDIYLLKDGQKANGRSILDVMAIAAGAGEIVIVADGPDEKDAVERLVHEVEEFESNELLR